MMSNAVPLTAVLRRRELHKKSTLAVGAALKEGAKYLPPGSKRSFIAKKAKRAEACALTAYHRIVTPNKQPSFVASSNKRACHQRYCFNCEAKRAAALASDTIDLLDYVWQLHPHARPLMLTLTSRNRALDQTRAMLLHHQKALKIFFSYNRLLKSTLGHFTNIEIDFAESKGQITTHVHSHSLVIVDAGALSDHRYIRQAEFVALWQRALKAPYKPIVDVRAIKGSGGASTDTQSLKGAVREVCKYCLDTQGFIQHDNGDLRVNPHVAVALALALHRRRLTSMDRIFNDAKKHRAKRRRAQAQTNSGL